MLDTRNELPNFNVVVELRTEYGNGGPQTGHCGQTGSKIHVLYVQEIVGVLDEEKAKAEPMTVAGRFLRTNRYWSESLGRHLRPVYFQVQAACNRNGQQTGVPIHGYGPADVTCARCKRSVGIA